MNPFKELDNGIWIVLVLMLVVLIATVCFASVITTCWTDSNGIEHCIGTPTAEQIEQIEQIKATQQASYAEYVATQAQRRHELALTTNAIEVLGRLQQLQATQVNVVSHSSSGIVQRIKQEQKQILEG